MPVLTAAVPLESLWTLSNPVCVASWGTVEVKQARFDYGKACWILVVDCDASLDYHIRWKPVEDCCACFEYCDARWNPVDVQQASFGYHIACWKIVEVQ